MHLNISSFKKNAALIFQNFDWKINHQESWAIIGNIGVGKTMLLKIIADIEYLPIVNGSILFSEKLSKDDIEYISFSDEKKWINRANFYYQQRYYTSFTEDEISVQDFLQLNNLSATEKEKTNHLLNKYSLFSLLGVPFIQLSNGQKNKCILIKALQSNKKLFLLDNPFIGIDAKSRVEIFSLIDTLISEQKKVIYSTNYLVFSDSTTHILSLQKNSVYTFYKKEDFNTSRLKEDFKKTEKQNFIPSVEIIELKNVTIAYNNKPILENINWTVYKGEKWMVYGVNGSGKSSLMSLLYADHPLAYKNEIYLFNEPRKTQSIWEIKAKIGYLSAEFHLHFNEPLTVLQTIGTGFTDTLSLQKSLTEIQLKQIENILTELNILHLQNRYFLNLSFGEQRLVLFARALIKQPDLLILDEPYQGLDQDAILLCNKYLDKHLSSEQTLIFTSHYKEEIPNCVYKELYLLNGKIVEHV